MFQRLPDISGTTIHFSIDGKPATGIEGDSVAAALLVAGHNAFRTTAVSGTERGPYCLMGACHDCYVEIDGMANQQACRVLLRDGMSVLTQHGKRDLGR